MFMVSLWLEAATARGAVRGAASVRHSSRIARRRSEALEAKRRRSLPSCDAITTTVAASAMSRASAASKAINTVPPMGFEPMLERV